jgi:hypothetical protein
MSAQLRGDPGLGGGFGQADEESVVVAALRVPLNAQPERTIGVFHGFDGAVGGPGGHLEARVLDDRLVMVATDLEIIADQPLDQ